MLHVDIPTLGEFKTLNQVRAQACVSIYLPTTPVSQDADASRIAFGNLVRGALEQVEAAGVSKQQIAALAALCDELEQDEEFWRFLAHSLAVLVTPEKISTFRLANKLSASMHVSDRFHLKPLLRAITFGNAGFVLALSENHARLVQFFADLPPQIVAVPGLPKDAASLAGMTSTRQRSDRRGLPGAEGKKLQLAKFARAVDRALRPTFSGLDVPMVLAAAQPLASIYASVNSYPGLLKETIDLSPDRTSEGELAERARPLLDNHHAEQIRALHELYEKRAGDGRATSDLSDAARAATFGAVEALLVDIDDVVFGTLDEDSGAISFADRPSADSYGVIDEIAGRALMSGARVLGVRKDDIPGRAKLAAILRFAV